MTDRDPWHIGELPGDDGRTVRDQNGLKVLTATTAREARQRVLDHGDDPDA